MKIINHSSFRTMDELNRWFVQNNPQVINIETIPENSRRFRVWYYDEDSTHANISDSPRGISLTDLLEQKYTQAPATAS